MEISQIKDGPACISELPVGWMISARCPCGRQSTLDRDYLGRRGGYDTPWEDLRARLRCKDYRCRNKGGVQLYLEKMRR